MIMEWSKNNRYCSNGNPKTMTLDELVESLAISMREMSGEALAELYNREFGEGMKYVGDSQFEVDPN